MLQDSQLARAAVLAGVALLSYYVLQYLQSPLRRIPGPFLARFTDLWRVGSLRTGRAHLAQIQLHRRLGYAVRLGPNMVSISDPTLIPTIYSSSRPWLKSDMYSSNDVSVNGVITSNIFATRDPVWHTKMVKPIRNMGTITKTLVNCESAVDDTIRLICSQMDKMAREGTTVQMEKWMLYFAYDTLHKLTFNSHRGFLETGNDVGDFIKDAYSGLVYFGLCVSMPVIDRFVVKNPLVKPFLGAPPFAWGFKQAYADVAARKAMHAAAHTSPGSSDFLDLFLAARDAYPDIVTGDDVVVNYLFLFLVAGSDTTGTVLAAILYYVYRDPAILAKLRAELATVCDGSAPIKYRDGVKLPYFDAVVHEGLRIHPPIGLAFERVVPAGGWQMPEGGPLLPPGVKVGVNAWVSNRDEKTFGPEDVDGFVPERWLARDGETAEEWSSRASRMKHLLFTFGYGSRICTGKSVALLELVKLVGTFVARYDVEFLVPEWKTKNIWFVFPSGFDVKVKLREGVGELST